METKLTREYAEKLAKEMLKPSWSHLYIGGELTNEPEFFVKEKERIIDGYMKAIEETNAKGLLESLEKIVKKLEFCTLHNKRTFGEEYLEAIEAIKKANTNL
jgi:hypothetical protein